MSTTTIVDHKGRKTTIKQSHFGCLGWLAVLVVAGSCINMPVLIVPTIVILGLFALAKAHQ